MQNFEQESAQSVHEDKTIQLSSLKFSNLTWLKNGEKKKNTFKPATEIVQ